MTRQEWLGNQNTNDDVTFIIAKSVKDDNSHFYHNEYRTTPIRPVYEWLRSDDEYVVINTDHPPIDVTGNWGKWYRSGRLKCAVITTKEDLYIMYGELAEKMLQQSGGTIRNK